MLVWINGAFGAGKTQTAFELHRRVPRSHVADPELIGFAIHKMLPASARRDFQDRPQWRAAVIATLADAAAAHDGPVIVPMTLVNPDYFDEIMAGLSAAALTSGTSVSSHHPTPSGVDYSPAPATCWAPSPEATKPGLCNRATVA